MNNWKSVFSFCRCERSDYIYIYIYIYWLSDLSQTSLPNTHLITNTFHWHRERVTELNLHREDGVHQPNQGILVSFSWLPSSRSFPLHRLKKTLWSFSFWCVEVCRFLSNLLISVEYLCLYRQPLLAQEHPQMQTFCIASNQEEILKCG
jgi:hypothetical protein